MSLKRLAALEARLTAAHRLADGPAPAVLRLVPVAGEAPELSTIRQYLAGAWPLVELRTWQRLAGEPEGAFLDRVVAGAGRRALLVEAGALA